jgi:GDP-D-mannose dehydratase
MIGGNMKDPRNLSIMFVQNGLNKKEDIEISQADLDDVAAVTELIKKLDPTEIAPFGLIADQSRNSPEKKRRPTAKEVLARYGVTSMHYSVDNGPIYTVGA